MTAFRVLPGLPVYGPPPVTFPTGWGHGVREGLVIEFQPLAGPVWVGNFDPGGLRYPSDVRMHPNGKDVLVTCEGSLWHVHVDTRTADLIANPVLACWPVSNPEGFVYDDAGLSLLRVGPAGVLWHTRRISWDGFERITLEGDRLAGYSWSPIDDAWSPFTVDLTTGMVAGGSYSGPW